MRNTDLIIVTDKLDNPNKVAQSIIVANDYYKIIIKYKGDYNIDAAAGKVTKHKLRYNSRPAEDEMDGFTPILTGSDDMLTVYTKQAMLTDDLSFDIYMEILQAAKETREKLFKFINERFPN